MTGNDKLKLEVWKNIEAGSKTMKKSVLFKEDKKTTGLIKKIKEVIYCVFYFLQ